MNGNNLHFSHACVVIFMKATQKNADSNSDTVIL